MNTITPRRGHLDRLRRIVLLHRVADVFGKLWALPYTVVGLVYGLCTHVVSRMLGGDASIRLGNNAVQFINCLGVLKGRAITVGNVILYGCDAEPWRYGAYGDARVNLGRHEQAHTYQYQVLGPLFVLAYFWVGGFCGPAGNPFERAAQRFGARQESWWPD